MTEPTCRTCKFFKMARAKNCGAELGSCRRYPPKFYDSMLADMQGKSDRNTTLFEASHCCLWPIVRSEDFCGEYVAVWR